MPLYKLPYPGELARNFSPDSLQTGILPIDRRLYRYASNDQQLVTPSQKSDWTYMSEDAYISSREAIERLSLLNFVLEGVVFQPGVGYVRSDTKPQDPWNAARIRGTFVAMQGIPVWFGTAGSKAFDIYRGLEARPDKRTAVPIVSEQVTGVPRIVVPVSPVPVISKPGGGSQVLVRTTDLPKLQLVATLILPW